MTMGGLTAKLLAWHFRPKKSAKNVKGLERDGYWWLAFNYMNFRIAGNVPNRKKGTWFPLRYGSRYSTYSRPCEEEETPHFLDPTSAYDVNLLAFDEEGKAIPAPGISKWDTVRVRRSIERLKLTEHQALAEERRKIGRKLHAPSVVIIKQNKELLLHIPTLHETS